MATNNNARYNIYALPKKSGRAYPRVRKAVRYPRVQYVTVSASVPALISVTCSSTSSYLSFNSSVSASNTTFYPASASDSTPVPTSVSQSNSSSLIILWTISSGSQSGSSGSVYIFGSNFNGGFN